MQHILMINQCFCAILSSPEQPNIKGKGKMKRKTWHQKHVQSLLTDPSFQILIKIAHFQKIIKPFFIFIFHPRLKENSSSILKRLPISTLSRSLSPHTHISIIKAHIWNVLRIHKNKLLKYELLECNINQTRLRFLR